MTFVRVLIRVVFLIVVAVLLAMGGTLAWFSSWRAGKLVELQEASTIAETKAGPVEYSNTGEGAPVLVFHATPGGYDQAALLAAPLEDEGFQIIAPSRPGYLRTPLRSGLTPESQADAMAALLDELDIPSVIIVGASFGSPAALEFVRRHTQRTTALVLLSAVVSQQRPTTEKQLFPQALNDRLTGDIGCWLARNLAERDPAIPLRTAFDLTHTGGEAVREGWVGSVISNPAQLDTFQALVGSVAPMGPREDGLRNDLLQIKAFPPFPFATITVPVLFIHGEADSVIPIDAVRAAAARIPNATVVAVPYAGHLVQLGPESDPARKSLIDFARLVSAPPQP